MAAEPNASEELRWADKSVCRGHTAVSGRRCRKTCCGDDDSGDPSTKNSRRRSIGRVIARPMPGVCAIGAARRCGCVGWPPAGQDGQARHRPTVGQIDHRPNDRQGTRLDRLSHSIAILAVPDGADRVRRVWSKDPSAKARARHAGPRSREYVSVRIAGARQPEGQHRRRPSFIVPAYRLRRAGPAIARRRPVFSGGPPASWRSGVVSTERQWQGRRSAGGAPAGVPPAQASARTPPGWAAARRRNSAEQAGRQQA